MTEWEQLEREMDNIGFPLRDHVCRPGPRGPFQWRETIALARVRAAETGRRYRVYSYLVDGRLVYGCGPYPPESLRATTPTGRSVPDDPGEALIGAGQEILDVFFGGANSA